MSGNGLAHYKIVGEYGLGAACLAGAFWLRHLRRQPAGLHLLVLSGYLMALGVVGIAMGPDPWDAGHLVASIFQILAYGLLCRTILMHGLQLPHFTLQRRDAVQTAMLESLPIGIARFDTQGRCHYANQEFQRLTGITCDASLAQALGRVLPDCVVVQIADNLHAFLGSRKRDFEIRLERSMDTPIYCSVRLVPEYDEHDSLQGMLVALVDTTASEEAKRHLTESLALVSNLRTALDAHAIVAITDSHGVIQQVNDKFCEISQYTRDELIGQTHSTVHSHQHPPAFFRETWEAISKGAVWHGEICNRNKSGEPYWLHTTITPFRDQDGRIAQYVGISTDITARKHAIQEARHMALHDALSGLPNRRMMLEQLANALQQSGSRRRHGALVLLDIDNFKEINDTLGHVAGDALLKSFAERLRSHVRSEDTVARLGGDEFGLLLEGIGQNPEEAASRAMERCERLREIMAEPTQLEGERVTVFSSFGITLFQGASAGGTDELFKQADLALYRAKADGRNCVRHFEPHLAEHFEARTSLQRDLLVALEHGELQLHYQYVVDTVGTVQGVEALLRWKHPARGLVPPGTFIPLAEQTHVILGIGQWVLEQACHQLGRWAEDPQRRNWSIAVNVSARQFRDSDFVAKVAQALAISGASPSLLRLEITESMLHSDLDNTAAKMQILRTMGVSFSMDDFGTGYSSLAYLKRLPLDVLKIDRSFVKDLLRDENSAAIVRTTLALARELGLRAIAEGVESIEQRDMLATMGCDGFQGYLFGRPEPLAEPAAPAAAARADGVPPEDHRPHPPEQGRT